ncbi:hypothetical protein [Aeromicrobium sp. NPDC092404]|uniref:hypothetical protein n=1 Tax=Aeromicrobium sp. NPDC092404 TaxID=3154976 RepID=UPI003420C151
MSTITDAPKPPASPTARSAARIALLVVAIASLLVGATALAGGGALIAADRSWRDDGYLTSDTTPLKTDSRAVASESMEIGGMDEDWVLGRVRVRVTGLGTAPVFVGVARTSDAEAYLAGVDHATVTEIDDPATTYERHAGGAPAVVPGDSDIWLEQASGTGTQSIDWSLDDRPERWTIVVMNADGTAGVDVDTDVGATVPVLGEATAGLIVIGGLFVLVGAGILVGLRVTGRSRTADGAR